MTLLLAIAAALAEPVNPFREPDESELFRFEEQLVTVASRYAQTVRKAPSILEVITADEIRQRGYRTVADALRDLPGIYVWKTIEGRSIASFRGVVSADNNKLLVLVDGQPWYDGAYSHGFIGDYLPLSNVKQIEIIKGPGSAIYGTNAFSGVVNIVTFDAKDLEGGRVRWQAGAHGRSDLVATAGGTLRVGALDAKASTYARLLNQTGEGLLVTPRNDIDIQNIDPKRSVNVGVRLEIEGLKLQAHHVDYSHTYLLNGREDPFAALSKTLGNFDLNYRNSFFDARYDLKPTRDLTITPYYAYQSHDNPAAYFFGNTITVDPNTLEAEQSFVTVDAEKVTSRWSAGLDLQARPGLDHVLVGGFGVENTSVLRFFDRASIGDEPPVVLNGFTVIDDCGQAAGLYSNTEKCRPPQLRNLFGYAQYTWTATSVLELTAGARVDKRVPMNEGEEGDDGVFVLSVSPRAGVLFVPSERTTAKLLYGRALRAPNVRELLVRSEARPDGTYPFATGNIELVPEYIHTVEGEVTTRPTDGLELRANSSYSALSKEIDKIPPGVYCNLPGNLNIVGAELGFVARGGPVRLSSTYALTLARYADEDALDPAICDFEWPDPYAGRQQYEFPTHMVKSRAGLAITEALQIWTLSEVYSERPRNAWSPDANMPDGVPFGLFHLGLSLDDLGPQQNVRVGASVRNLLNTTWNYGIYRDDANTLGRYNPMLGESRSILVDVEAAF